MTRVVYLSCEQSPVWYLPADPCSLLQLAPSAYTSTVEIRNFLTIIFQIEPVHVYMDMDMRCVTVCAMRLVRAIHGAIQRTARDIGNNLGEILVWAGQSRAGIFADDTTGVLIRGRRHNTHTHTG